MNYRRKGFLYLCGGVCFKGLAFLGTVCGKVTLRLYGNMGMSLNDYAASVGKTTDEVKDEWQKLEDAQKLVLENASNAYKTAGMSANQYMETATSFSAHALKMPMRSLCT